MKHLKPPNPLFISCSYNLYTHTGGSCDGTPVCLPAPNTWLFEAPVPFVCWGLSPKLHLPSLSIFFHILLKCLVLLCMHTLIDSMLSFFILQQAKQNKKNTAVSMQSWSVCLVSTKIVFSQQSTTFRGWERGEKDDWYALNWVRRLDMQSIFHHVGLAVGLLPQLSMCVSSILAASAQSSQQHFFCFPPPSSDLRPHSSSFIVQQVLTPLLTEPRENVHKWFTRGQDVCVCVYVCMCVCVCVFVLKSLLINNRTSNSYMWDLHKYLHDRKNWLMVSEGRVQAHVKERENKPFYRS